MRKICIIAMVLIFIASMMGCDAKVTGLSLHPDNHDFGIVNLGDKQLMHFRVKNLANNTFTITKIQLMGVSTNNFRITSGYAVPKYLQPQGYVIISVEYEPKNAGLHVAFIQITHNGPKISERIDLLGTGFPVPRMIISTENIDFGVVYVTRSGIEEIVLENVGTDRMIVSSLNFDNPTITEFTIKSGGIIPIMINPGESHTIEVEMAPPTDSRYNNVLLISHNAIDKISPVRVILQGEGVTYAPEMDLSQTSPWDIGSHSTGAPAILDLDITSDGVDPLTVTSATFATGTNYSVDEVQDNNGNVVNLPQLIPVGNKVTIKIKFAPTANAIYNDTLTIVHDAINEPTPYDIQIEGEGRIPIIKTFNYTGSIENWTVPAGVTMLTIEVWGAEGGGDSGVGGKGARMKGDFTVTPGDTIKILVGEKGKNSGTSWSSKGGGGGGASYVCKSNNDPIIIAGAGGGKTNTGSYTTNPGRITEDGGDTYQNGGGNNGMGGNTGITNGQAAGGGGLLTDGQSYSSSYGGKSFLNGGAGGNGSISYPGGNGGFGGGGGGNHNSLVRSGGAGGYSGGQGGTWSGQYSGGGGGSYNHGTNKSNTAGARNGNGEVKITY